MKTDFSFLLFEKNFSLKNNCIELTLKNNTVLIGKFIGYFYGDANEDEPHIIKWHFIQNEDKSNGFETLGDSDGLFVEQENIAKVKFFDDQTVMLF